MKRKKLFTLFVCVAIMSTILTACSSDKVEKALTKYTKEQMPPIAEYEDTVTSEFNTALEAENGNLETMLATLNDTVIPTSEKLIQEAKAVKIENKELAAIHEKYIEAKTTQNIGLNLLAEALMKDGASNIAAEATNVLKDANEQIQVYTEELNAFADANDFKLE